MFVFYQTPAGYIPLHAPRADTENQVAFAAREAENEPPENKMAA